MGAPVGHRLEHSLPRAFRTPARPEAWEQPGYTAPLDMQSLTAASRALRRFRQQPGIDECRRDDAKDEKSCEEPEENGSVAHR
jgi:hypothetical protein